MSKPATLFLSTTNSSSPNTHYTNRNLHGEADGEDELHSVTGDLPQERGVQTEVGSGADTQFVSFVLMLQRLLHKFTHPTVRMDFTNDEFGCCIDPKVLERIPSKMPMSPFAVLRTVNRRVHILHCISFNILIRE